MSSGRPFSTAESLVAARPGAINRHIVQALFSLISAALLFRIGGMVNQVIVSASFGAGAAMDAYFVAAAFPLLLIQLLSSALEAAIVPVYSRLRLHANRDAASSLLSTLVNCLVISAILLLLVLIVLRQPLVFLSAPGLDLAREQQSVALAPMLYLVIPLSLVISLFECILNAEGQFGWPAYAGLLVPLTTALLTVLGGRTWGITALCLGCFCGTVLQLVVVGVRVKQARLHYRLTIDIRNPDLLVICRAAWPLLLGSLIVQGGPLVDQIFASTLPIGNISSLNYALKLVSIFIGVIFVSVGRVVLPYLARQAALGDPSYQAFKRTLHMYLWCIGLSTLLLSLLLLLLVHPLVQLLFQHGAFSAIDTRNTAMILAGFAPGLMPMASNFLLSRAFNALGETRVPMYMALVNVGANAFFDALFAHFWQGLGIALATSVVSLITTLLLLVLLFRRIGVFQIWSMPTEMRIVVTHLKSCWRRPSCLSARTYRFNRRSIVCQTWLYGVVTLIVLAAGVIATVRDAVSTLRISVGSLLVLCFLRYPFGLLLAWASLNVCVGSSLAGFNGNNLDMLLIFPLFCLFAILPWKEIIRRMPGLIWLAFYLVWVFLGIGLSPLNTRAFLTLWLTMLASVGVGALTIALITTRARLLMLIDILLATALLAALYGLYGFVSHQHGEIDPATSLFRVTSLFTQATSFALYLSLLIPLAFYRCLYARGVFRLISTTILLSLLGALLLTFTRSAYAGVFGGACIIACCLSARRVRLLVVCGLLLFGGMLLYLAWSGHLFLLARFFDSDVVTLNGRFYLWQALLNNFQVTRWLGGGLQSSDQLLAYLRVGVSGQGVIGTAPHSLFLGTLYDHGVVGLFLLCIAFLCLGHGLLQGIWRSSGERRMLYAVALASLVAMLLQSFGSRDLWIQAVGVSFWIIIALPLACCWPGSEKTVSKPQGANAWLPSGYVPGAEEISQNQIDRYVEGEV